MTVAPGARTVAVVTPWYPTRLLPFRGAFVQAMVEATAPGVDRMTVIHGDRWSAKVSAAEDEAIGRAHLALLPQTTRTSTTVGGAELMYLPVPMPAEVGFAPTAVRHEATLRAALNGRPIDAAVVHVHEALPSGWAVLDHLRPETRLFVTEHASFLERLLAEPESRACTTRCCAAATAFRGRRRHPGHPAQGAPAARRTRSAWCPTRSPSSSRAGAGHRVAPLAVPRRPDPAQGRALAARGVRQVPRRGPGAEPDHRRRR